MWIKFNIFSNRTYFLGVFFTLISIFVSLLINVILYPIYWKVLSVSDFQNWFSIFEFSLFFLLADIGFSQEFIKNCANKDINFIQRSYEVLRGVLLVISLIVLVFQLPIFFYLRRPSDIHQFLPYCFLAISTAVTLWSYAETAALRVLLKFNSIAAISIFGNFVFLFLVYYFNEFGVYTIAIGVLVRALVISISQNFLLSKYLKIKTVISFKFKMIGANAIMNFSYLATFAFDAVALPKLGIKNTDVASYMLNRKIYDLIRSFFDAAMNVISVKLSTHKISDHIFLVAFLLIFVFFGVYALGPVIYRVAINSSAFDSGLSFSLAFSGLCTALIRYFQLSFYMTNQTSLIFRLFLGIMGIKAASFLFVFFVNVDVIKFSVIQNIFLILLIFHVYHYYRRRSVSV